MKRFYFISAALLVAVFFIVLLVPGVAESIEVRLLSWLSGAAT
jgi:hypothetical protein